MKDLLLKKLTINIETTNQKNIPSELMELVYALEKSTDSTHDVKVSFALDENDKAEIKKNDFDYVSPANWDYWPV